MTKTKSPLDTRETFVYDRALLEEKFKKMGVYEKITELLESHEIFEYFEKNLVRKVSKWSKAFATEEARQYFNQVIARENLMMNVRANIENNLIINAIEFWFKLDQPLDDIIHFLLTPDFVKQTINVLAREIENLEYDIKSREYEGLPQFNSNGDNKKNPIN